MLCSETNDVKEIAFRAQLLSEWKEELDRCIRYTMPTRIRYYIRTITELEQEAAKLEAWIGELTLIDSFFCR